MRLVDILQSYLSSKKQDLMSLGLEVIMSILVTTVFCIRPLVLKFLNFRYHGNKAQSKVNINDTTKLADFETSGNDSRLYLSYKPS